MRILFALTALACSPGLPGLGVAAAESPAGPAARNVMSTNPNARAVRDYESRLALLERAVSEIEELIARSRSSVLNGFLQDAPALGLGGGAGGLAPPKMTASEGINASDEALKLLRSFGPRFARRLSPDGVSDRELDVFIADYARVLEETQTELLGEVRSVVATDSGEGTTTGVLCLVLPMLHTPDDDWSAEDTGSIPAWVRSGMGISALEEFSLDAGRPLTAYAFVGLEGGEESVTEYLERSASRLTRLGRFDGAIACLEALAVRSMSSEAADLSLRIAQLESDIGRPSDAADRIAAGLELLNEPDAYARHFAELMRYLYAARRDADAIDAYERAAERLGARSPVCLFVAWASSYRLSDQRRTEAFAETFFNTFPSHPLGADIRFAKAMTALGEARYEEADRLLEFIEYRYPGSRLSVRIAEIRARLAAQEEGQP